MQLEPLPYHVAVADRLEQAEPELWQWFRSDSFAESYKRETTKDLLRTGIRLDRNGANERRYRLAEAARDKLGLSEPVVLYQMQGTDDVPNAFLVFTPGEIVIGFRGRILELLDTDAELLDLIGHEISHYKLFVAADGRHHTADRLLSWLVQREGCPAELIETWRRHRLFSEIYCDVGGLLACGDRDATIRGLVKAIADFKDADAESYFKQAEQLMTLEPGATRGTTHPELHVRVLAVAWSETLPAAELHTRLEGLVCGPVELGGLDLLDQHRLADLSRAVLGRVLADEAMRSETTLAHARQMFPDYEPPATPKPLTRPALALSQSIVDYLAYLLLDLATVEGSGLKTTIAVAAAAADEMGFGARFREVARQELRGRRGLQAGLASRTA